MATSSNQAIPCSHVHIFYFKNYLFTKFIYTFIASTGVYPIGLAMKNTSKCMIKVFFESKLSEAFKDGAGPATSAKFKN